MEGGVEALKELGYKGKDNLLRARKDEIIAALEANPPATLKDTRAIIKEVTGLDRSLPQVSAFLAEHKIIRRKVKQIPAKADIKAQETFKTETLEPLIEQARQRIIHLFFVDAAHFVLLPFLGYLYSLTVRYIKSASGRQRFNVLGALNAITHELVTVANHTYINALSVCELLEKIERLWKFVKEMLRKQHHTDYSRFCTAISDCLEQTHKGALDTLLTLKFQTFENVSFQP